MLLAVDVGNTQTSFGVFYQSKLLRHWRIETKPSRTADEYAAFFQPLIQHAQLSGTAWEAGVLCSVVPPAEHSLELFFSSYLGLSPFKVNCQMDLGFQLNVHHPQEVGADRLANTAYAVNRLKLPAIVIDFGTATTFDVISKAGIYEGGAIIPGLRLCIEALGAKTSKLPTVQLDFPKTVVGKNTIECIQGGVLYGYCDMVSGLLKRTLDELGGTAEVVATGGLAALVSERIEYPNRILPNLTLEGIEILYQRMKTSRQL